MSGDLTHIPEQEAQLDVVLDEIDRIAQGIVKSGKDKPSGDISRKKLSKLIEQDSVESFYDFDDETGTEIPAEVNEPERDLQEARIQSDQFKRSKLNKELAARKRQALASRLWSWLSEFRLA